MDLKSRRICIVTWIAFWELFSSGLSSITLAQRNWDMLFRGGLILSLAISNILLRIIQIIYWKCQLKNVAAGRSMHVTTIETDNLNVDTESNVINEYPEGGTNTETMHLTENYSLSALEQTEDNEGTPTHKLKRTETQIMEEEASDIYNYNFALYFIAFSTLSDASFDIIQAVILISGLTTKTSSLAVIGSIIGFNTELLDFIEEMFGFACDFCKEDERVSGTLAKIWCIVVSLGCITEQSIAIYVLFTELQREEQHSLLFYVSFVTNTSLILIGLIFIGLATTHSKASISLMKTNRYPSFSFYR
eukprot:438790_1